MFQTIKKSLANCEVVKLSNLPSTTHVNRASSSAEQPSDSSSFSSYAVLPHLWPIQQYPSSPKKKKAPNKNNVIN